MGVLSHWAQLGAAAQRVSSNAQSTTFENANDRLLQPSDLNRLWVSTWIRGLFIVFATCLLVSFSDRTFRFWFKITEKSLPRKLADVSRAMPLQNVLQRETRPDSFRKESRFRPRTCSSLQSILCRSKHPKASRFNKDREVCARHINQVHL